MPISQTENIEKRWSFKELPTPKPSAFHSYSGKGTELTAIARLKSMTPEEWEHTTLAYADALLNEGKYSRVVEFGGTGDKGRDIVALLSGEEILVENQWDCFQCKHYQKPLSLSMVLPELEKFTSFIFANEYPLPNKYFLVSPCGLGPELSGIMFTKNAKNDAIKGALLKRKNVAKNPAYSAFIDRFDFNRIDFVPPHKMIKQLQKSYWGAAIFDMPLAPLPPFVEPNPPLEQEQSAQYVNALCEAYRDYKKNPCLRINDLSRTDSQLWKHFERSRKAFHSTEAMFRFYRSSVPPDSDSDLLREVEDGISNVFFDPDIVDGYRRVLRAVEQAKVIDLNNSIYKDQIRQLEREGACHHLSNRSNNPVSWMK